MDNPTNTEDEKIQEKLNNIEDAFDKALKKPNNIEDAFDKALKMFQHSYNALMLVSTILGIVLTIAVIGILMGFFKGIEFLRYCAYYCCNRYGYPIF